MEFHLLANSHKFFCRPIRSKEENNPIARIADFVLKCYTIPNSVSRSTLNFLYPQRHNHRGVSTLIAPRPISPNDFGREPPSSAFDEKVLAHNWRRSIKEIFVTTQLPLGNYLSRLQKNTLHPKRHLSDPFQAQAIVNRKFVTQLPILYQLTAKSTTVQK